jgi:hypothetical protein
VCLTRVRVAIGAAFMLWSPNVTAQEPSFDEACVAEAKSLCSGIAGTGIEPLRGCFRDHIKEVSEACLLSIAELLEHNPACRVHMNQQCGNVKIGEGRLEVCLRTAVDTLSDSCKDGIVRAIPGNR